MERLPINTREYRQIRREALNELLETGTINRSLAVQIIGEDLREIALSRSRALGRNSRLSIWDQLRSIYSQPLSPGEREQIEIKENLRSEALSELLDFEDSLQPTTSISDSRHPVERAADKAQFVREIFNLPNVETFINIYTGSPIFTNLIFRVIEIGTAEGLFVDRNGFCWPFYREYSFTTAEIMYKLWEQGTGYPGDRTAIKFIAGLTEEEILRKFIDTVRK